MFSVHGFGFEALGLEVLCFGAWHCQGTLGE